MIIILIAATLLGTACSSPTFKPSTPATTASAVSVPSLAHSDPFQQLSKGLTAAQVKALLGEPQQIKPFDAKGMASEIWVYRRTVPGPSRLVVARMREVPYVNPLTGVMQTLQEPMYETEATSVDETTELLMFSGTLAGWKQHRETSRSFN